MDRNTRRKGLINYFVLLIFGTAVFAVAGFVGSLAGQVAVAFFGLGKLIAFVSWFQMRLEEREATEKLEIEELSRTKSGSTLFESKTAGFFPAQNARVQFEKYFVTSFMVVLLALEISGAIILWRSLGRIDYTGILASKALIALGLFGGLALVLFMVGRFMVAFARLETNRLLRPAANFILLGS